MPRTLRVWPGHTLTRPPADPEVLPTLAPEVAASNRPEMDVPKDPVLAVAAYACCVVSVDTNPATNIADTAASNAIVIVFFMAIGLKDINDLSIS